MRPFGRRRAFLEYSANVEFSRNRDGTGGVTLWHLAYFIYEAQKSNPFLTARTLKFTRRDGEDTEGNRFWDAEIDFVWYKKNPKAKPPKVSSSGESGTTNRGG